MKCVHCKKEFDSAIPEINAESYGSNIYACPHCGMPYKFYRAVHTEPLWECPLKKDDWGKQIKMVANPADLKAHRIAVSIACLDDYWKEQILIEDCSPSIRFESADEISVAVSDEFYRKHAQEIFPIEPLTGAIGRWI